MIKLIDILKETYLDGGEQGKIYAMNKNKIKKQILPEEFRRMQKLAGIQINENLDILSKEIIKKAALHDLKFQSDDYSEESSYWGGHESSDFVRDKYLDVINNPTLDSYIEAVFYALPIEYGDEIYDDPYEVEDLLGEIVGITLREIIGENQFKEIEEELLQHVENYSKILLKKFK